jgi:hypothetical protein
MPVVGGKNMSQLVHHRSARFPTGRSYTFLASHTYPAEKLLLRSSLVVVVRVGLRSEARAVTSFGTATYEYLDSVGFKFWKRNL